MCRFFQHIMSDTGILCDRLGYDIFSKHGRERIVAYFTHHGRPIRPSSPSFSQVTPHGTSGPLQMHTRLRRRPRLLHTIQRTPQCNPLHMCPLVRLHPPPMRVRPNQPKEATTAIKLTRITISLANAPRARTSKFILSSRLLRP